MPCDKILKQLDQRSGFTLVELAVVIMISGFIMLITAQFVKLYTVSLKHEKTLEHLEISQDALFEFFGRNGRYPCPADPTLTPNDPDFGLERCRSTTDLADNPNNCNGAPDNLSCVITKKDGSNHVVMIGVFPFRTVFEDIKEVNYSQTYRLDGYSRYLSYAVTEHMTDRTRYNIVNPVNNNKGVIRVLDENGKQLTVPEDSAHYVVYSHGDNGVGAYTSAGKRIDGCTIPSAIVGDPPDVPKPGYSSSIKVEIENCDNNDAIFAKAIRSLGDNSSYNDDILMFTTTGMRALWVKSLASPQGQSYIYNTNTGNVGIGTDSPTHNLHIVGDLSVYDADVISTGYCDEVNNSDCLLPSAIAGSGSKCPNPRQVAYAIQDNKLVCRDVDWVMPTDKTCPSGEYLVAFSNLGNIKCVPPP